MTKADQSSRLRPNSVTMLGALAMSAAFMGPAVSTFFNTPAAAQVAGKVFPLSFLISMIAVIFIANSVIEFSKKVPAAGFAFTFASHGAGPKTGFMAGWTLLLGYGMISPITYAGFGMYGSEFLLRQFGWHVPWWILFVAVGLLISLLSYLGIGSSAMATIIFLVLELGVVLALCGTVVFGGGHNTFEPFSPANATHGLSSIGLAMVFGILSFTGFEAAANLGEETRGANRTIPRAIIIAVIAIGLVYVLGAYTAEIGFNSFSKLASDPSPFDTLAREFWGNHLAWIVDLPR
ncbi:MAG: APC family permease [Alicyclobacillus sp.]|nr:APC family permease [Alicyclobacillus sp.]